MQVAVLTFDGFNELDSFIAAAILNRLRAQGWAATFMAKPFNVVSGCSMHLHVSLWKDGRNVFAPVDGSESEIARQAIGGMMEHLAGITLPGAPTVNSYKRIGVGAPTSGATWAPAYATYGMNNRTQSIRIPAPGRIEIRSTDGSANPYLAAAAIRRCKTRKRFAT